MDRLDEAHAFDNAAIRKKVRSFKKVEARRLLRSVKDDDGFPLIHSIVEVGPDGREVQHYKQEMLFTIGEYKQVIEYCSQKEGYWRKLKRHLVKNARERFGKQTSLFD